jgi:CsoR family transcriptional regulator, copper-sensing transcriptional repressor
MPRRVRPAMVTGGAEVNDVPPCHGDEAATTAVSSAGHGYLATKASHQTALRRIEGQVRGLQRMVDEEKYCIDILTQISAVTGALQRVALTMLEEHLGHCVVRAAQAGGEEADLKVKEAASAIARLVRS